MIWAAMRGWLGLAGISSLLLSCSLFVVRPKPVLEEKRLGDFSTRLAPVQKTLKIYWSPNWVPFVEAQTDEDLAFGLGLVQAHLRLGQIEVFRMVSQGRLAEMAGPLAVDFEKTLRIMSLDIAVDKILVNLPQETLVFLENFVRGLNFQQAKTQNERPRDSRALNIPFEEFTVRDIIRMSRLFALDVNWGIYFSLLTLQEKTDFSKLLKLFSEASENSQPSFSASFSGPLTPDAGFEKFASLFNFGRIGSNSIVVGKSKTKTGSSFIASDPHLGLVLPNLWVLVGLESPSYHAVGMMIPGIPLMGLGRNPKVAWGGTNMWALSTHLFELSPTDLASAQRRTEKIKVRGWFDSEVEIRTTPWGPVFSDSPLFKESKTPFAFRWEGHEASDEITSFLKAMRAQNFKEFQKSFENYGVSAQSLLFADTEGNIGHVLAYRQPVFDQAPAGKLLLNKSNLLKEKRKPTQLPTAFNPKEGFIASANNVPVKTDPPLGRFYQSSERIRRLQAMATSAPVIDLQTLKTWQNDVFSEGSLNLVQVILKKMGPFLPKGDTQIELLVTLKAWDGKFSEDSRGPVAFETLMAPLFDKVMEKNISGDLQLVKALKRNSAWKKFLLQQLSEISDQDFIEVLNESLKTAERPFRKHKSWGDYHRIQVAHLLGNIPLVGGNYIFDEFGAQGGSDTLLKSASELSGQPGKVFYGSNSRHISDLSQIDENYFVLFGGQDGYLRGPQTTDQIELFRKGEYLRLPLSKEARSQVYNRAVFEIYPEKGNI